MITQTIKYMKNTVKMLKGNNAKYVSIKYINIEKH